MLSALGQVRVKVLCKTPLMLEETSIPYRTLVYDIFEGDHLRAEFGKINPTHKVPAIVDHAPAFLAEPIAVFETGALLQYLAGKSHAFLPESGSARGRVRRGLRSQGASLAVGR